MQRILQQSIEGLLRPLSCFVQKYFNFSFFMFASTEMKNNESEKIIDPMAETSIDKF